MHRYAVWAPGAGRVDLVTNPDGETVTTAMVKSEGGWWRDDGPWAEHGTDYGFRVDGGPLTPDPRSAWQPAGVHGASRVFDPERHEWQDASWTGAAKGHGALGRVIYELHVGTFTASGTLDGATAQLDHLVGLGVDVVQLMPVAAFEGRWGWGYDGVQPYAVHEPYGGPDALQRFVDAAHQRGLGVGLDVVYNHLGPSGNYLSRFGPYFTGEHRTPWGPGLNLDGEGNMAVRRWMIDNALRWFRDFHVDVLRLDAVHELADDSPTHVLAQLADETLILSRALERPLELIAESDLNDPVMVEPSAGTGMGMDAQWSDDLHHALHAALTGERQGYYTDFGSLSIVQQCLTRVFRHDGGWSSFRGSNWGHPVDTAKHDGHRFLAYLQTHDQIGNRAFGDRIGAVLTPGQQAIGAALVMTSAFTPMLFMGEEWAASTQWQFFSDFADPDLAQAVRSGRLAEFAAHGWTGGEIPDPQDPATRERSVLQWDEKRDGDHARMLSWYHSLISLRRSAKALLSGDLTAVTVDVDEQAGWLCMSRGDLRVVANFSDDAQQVAVSPEPIDVVLAWDPATTSLHEDGVDLGPHGVAVVKSLADAD